MEENRIGYSYAEKGRGGGLGNKQKSTGFFSSARVCAGLGRVGGAAKSKRCEEVGIPHFGGPSGGGGHDPSSGIRAIETMDFRRGQRGVKTTPVKKNQTGRRGNQFCEEKSQRVREECLKRRRGY